MRVDVSAVCRQALESASSEVEFDAAVGSVCHELYGRQAADVCDAVLSVIKRFASDRGVSRLEAARRFSRSESTLDLTVSTHVGGLPPEIAKALEEAGEDGGPGLHTRVVRHTWSSADGTPPPEELLELLRSGTGVKTTRRTVMTLPGGVRIPAWVGVGLMLVAVLAYGSLRIWQAYGNRFATIETALEEPERLAAEHGRSPRDAEDGAALARAYAGKVGLLRSLGDLRAILAPLATRTDRPGSEVLRRLGIADPKGDMLEAARAGERLAADLLRRPALSPAVEGDLRLALGHFLLAQGRTAEAAVEAARTVELDGGDVRPHILMAMVYEEEGDYPAAAREDEAALAKVDAWLARPPAAGDGLAFDLGPTPTVGLHAEGEDRRVVGVALRSEIETHRMTMDAIVPAPAP